MTYLEFFGCTFLAFGPPLSLFVFTIAKDPIRIIIMIASAFFWLLSFLISSLVWLIISKLGGHIVVGVCFSVLFQEMFRFLFYLLLRKAESGLKKLTDNNKELVTNKHILAYVSGLGYGVISGCFAIVNILADALGPGTVGLKGDTDWFFQTSAFMALCIILLHTVWGVLFFYALDRKRIVILCWVVGSHMVVSCLTLLNENHLYWATLIPSYLILIVTSLWALKVAGATWKSFVSCCKPASLALPVNVE